MEKCIWNVTAKVCVTLLLKCLYCHLFAPSLVASCSSCPPHSNLACHKLPAPSLVPSLNLTHYNLSVSLPSPFSVSPPSLSVRPCVCACALAGTSSPPSLPPLGVHLRARSHVHYRGREIHRGGREGVKRIECAPKRRGTDKESGNQ
jgi:hypothetical protein